MAAVRQIEAKLGDLFKGAPPLPANAKDWLVKAWPWLALIFGVLQLAAAWALWRLSTYTNALVDYANTLSLYTTGERVSGLSSVDRTWIYIGIAILVVDAIILFMAYPHLKSRNRRGWDLLFLGSLINVLYSVVTIFIDGRGFGSFLLSMVGSAIGFYLLFQIRDRYKTHA